MMPPHKEGDSMTEKELMLSGNLYIAQGEELARDYARARRLLRQIHSLTEEQAQERLKLFRQLFGSIGQKFWVEPPFHTDYGCNTYIGENFYANYDYIILDVARVFIGDHVFFGPRVSIYTAGHPIDAQVRNTQLEYGKEVKIGNDVWIGGNTVINPGVTIGSNVVIGSGSVVTKDIPDGVVAAGVPCRVIRAITDADRQYWQEQERRYRELMDKDL